MQEASDAHSELQTVALSETMIVLPEQFLALFFRQR